jgi:hypothetical protein
MEADIGYDPGEDWEGDSRGRPMMDFPSFFDAMFELADGELKPSCLNCIVVS